MFVCFTGGGIGHQNTALATRILWDALLTLFGLNLNNDASSQHNDCHQDISVPNDDNIEDSNGSDAPEDEEWEDIQLDIDDDDMDSTDFEDDGGECGADKEDELGFGVTTSNDLGNRQQS